MKLSKIEITNFRCFESLQIDLRKDVNVLVGINGAGKTTILDAIAIALYDVVEANGGGGRPQQKGALRPSDIRIVAGAEDDIKNRKDFVQIRAAAEDYHPLPGIPATARDGEGHEVSLAMEWTSHVTYQPPIGFRYSRKDSGALSPEEYFKALWLNIRHADARALIPLPVVAYYRSGRNLAAMPDLGAVLKKQLTRHGAFQDALNAGVDYQALFQWMFLRETDELRGRLAHRDDPDYEYPDLKAMRNAVRSMVENVEGIHIEGNPPGLRIEVRSAHASHSVLEIEQLSAGYRNLLALTMDFARRLAQAHPNWPNPLEAPGILLIDEIEMHLHPKWQQTVIPNLRAAFPNTQIIAATHSPAVLTTVRRENVHLLGSDHAIEKLPADVGTFGAESSRVLQEVFAVHARPPLVDTVGKLQEYLLLVEGQQQDTDRGLELRDELEAALGSSDPDLLAADSRISLLKALREK